MVVEARLRVRHRGCWTESVTGEAHVTQIGGDKQHGISVVHAATDEEAEAILARMAVSTARVDVVERSPGTVVVRCQCREDGIIATMLAFGCTILWPVMYADGVEVYTVVAPSRERMEALVERLREMGEVKVDRLSTVTADALDVSVSLSDITTGLTERQLTVLRRAVEAGYYATPRRTSAEALAKSFGVSRSTFEEHLRKAEQRVLERFAGILATHPALSAATTRKAPKPDSTRAAVRRGKALV